MKHMNPKIAKLLHEGFSINTIEKLNDVQLSVLYSRISEQSSGTLNIPKADTASIEKAKSEKKPFVTYEEELGEEDVNEKSVSKQQQKIMGLALSVKKGDTPKSKVSKKVKDMAKDMSKKDLEDFASTKHKGLPIYAMEQENTDEEYDVDVKNIEESILNIIEKHLPPHTTKGELLKTIGRKK
jgi:hypothetical protein